MATNEPKSGEFTVNSTFDFEGVHYWPMQQRTVDTTVDVEFNNVTLSRALPSDRTRLAEWLVREELYGPLGFRRPLREKYIKRSAVPVGTGGMAPVDFIIANRTASDLVLGFAICYEVKRLPEPRQEVDLALLDASGHGGATVVRGIQVALFTYIFAVCGARSVNWIRRKKVDDGLRHDHGHQHRYVRRGRRKTFSLEYFVDWLWKLQRRTNAATLPKVNTQTNR